MNFRKLKVLNYMSLSAFFVDFLINFTFQKMFKEL